MTLDALHDLSVSTLRDLAAALRGGSLEQTISPFAVGQIVGGNGNEEVCQCLDSLSRTGMNSQQVAILLLALSESQKRANDPSRLFDLVLSGPEVSGVPTGSTEAVMHSMVEQAKTELRFVGYAVYNGKKLFRRLAERMDNEQELQVSFCLDIRRPYQDTSLGSELVRRFVHDFKSKQWPGKRLPELYYYHASLNTDQKTKASLHAKCVICDQTSVLVTSANFTEAAQKKNIEMGSIIRHSPFVRRIIDYLDGLANAGRLVRVESGTL